jgi:hypothetical protein
MVLAMSIGMARLVYCDTVVCVGLHVRVDMSGFPSREVWFISELTACHESSAQF